MTSFCQKPYRWTSTPFGGERFPLPLQDKGFTEALFDRLRNQADAIMTDVPRGDRRPTAEHVLSAMASSQASPVSGSPVSRSASSATTTPLASWDTLGRRSASPFRAPATGSRKSPSSLARSSAMRSPLLTSPARGMTSPLVGQALPRASPLRNPAVAVAPAAARSLGFGNIPPVSHRSDSKKLPPTITTSTISAPFSHPASSVLSDDGEESVGISASIERESSASCASPGVGSDSEIDDGDEVDGPLRGQPSSEGAPLTPHLVEGLTGTNTSQWLRRMGASSPSVSFSDPPLMPNQSPREDLSR